jgi:rSAM/selenodomain-associated transferase 2
MVSTPRYSIIIPVLQEGDRIQSLLTHLVEICGQQNECPGERHKSITPSEVIVVDGDATGSTLARVPELGVGEFTPYPAEQPVLMVRGAIAPPGRGGQLNAGAALAKGEILLFLHSDARLPDGALAQIEQVLALPNQVGGAFDLQIDSTRWALAWIGRIASWRSRCTRVPYGDQGIFMQRECFEAVGGYPDIPIMEDVALMQALKQHGYRIGFIREPIRISPRRWEHEGILFCTLRNWTLISLYGLGVKPQRLVHWYRLVSS